MTFYTIDDILDLIRQELDLSTATQWEVLEEIRDHLEEAVAEAKAAGEDEQTALFKVAEKFGVHEVGQALQEVHAPWESAEAIRACFIPVLAALILRWFAFNPDGTVRNWEMWLLSPSFLIVALVLLLVPLIQFQQWRYTLFSWGFFWGITMIFVTLPNIQDW